MFRVEFIFVSLFGIKNLIFFLILRCIELYILYKLNKRYHFLFKKEITILDFFKAFSYFILALFFYYFTLIYLQYYIFVFPLLYFTFILTPEEKNDFYQKILKYLNKNNNPYCIFVEEQLELIYYILIFSFFLLYIGDFCHLENIEIFMILGFSF